MDQEAGSTKRIPYIELQAAQSNKETKICASGLWNPQDLSEQKTDLLIF